MFTVSISVKKGEPSYQSSASSIEKKYQVSSDFLGNFSYNRWKKFEESSQLLISQMVDQVTVNPRVRGSNPAKIHQ